MLVLVLMMPSLSTLSVFGSFVYCNFSGENSSRCVGNCVVY